MQHVNHMRATDRLGIVNSRVCEAKIFPELLGTLFRDKLHVLFRAKLQASGGTRLDASRLQPLTYAVRAQRALVNLLGDAVEFWDVERASRYTELAADTVLLL